MYNGFRINFPYKVRIISSNVIIVIKSRMQYVWKHWSVELKNVVNNLGIIPKYF